MRFDIVVTVYAYQLPAPILAARRAIRYAGTVEPCARMRLLRATLASSERMGASDFDLAAPCA